MDPAELWVGGDAGHRGDDEGEDEALVKIECTCNSARKRSLLLIYLIICVPVRPIDHKSLSHKVSHTPQNTITRVRCVITLRARREDACAKENEAVVLFVSAAGPAEACNRLRGSRKNCQFEGVSTLPVLFKSIIQPENAQLLFGLVWILFFYCADQSLI